MRELRNTFITDRIGKENNYDNQHRAKEQLEEELADAKLLHQLSIELIQEDGTTGLYKKIVEAAVAIMGSQYASMQVLIPDGPDIGKLRLIACSGFSPEAEKFWEWVHVHTGSSCGAALCAQQRVIVPNFATCDFMKDKPTLPMFLEAGIYAAQSTPLYSRGGELVGMISTHWSYPHTPSDRHLYLFDILARQAADLIERTKTGEALRQSEEQLRSLMTILENKVEDRTKELHRSNEDLQKFAHVASHDLKEPVRKIRTFGLRLKEELKNAPNETLSTYTEKILESAGRMSTMIEGVLMYSSLNALEQPFETIDLNKIVSDICNDLEILIQQKDAVLQYGALPEIKGIEVLIYQVFYNVINNSLKFSKENERPVISISASNISIDGTDHVRIVVTDNGVGFDPAYNTSIFKTFTRLHSKMRYEGTGLGLSLAKKIIERHYGTIEADGRKDVGTVVTITLPTSPISPGS